ncbi:putative metal-binding motif-containing protein, partial [Myxococcota bacterium]|nr:putative metal-binding motif-containing protein [Myxococcota bacterium]
MRRPALAVRPPERPTRGHPLPAGARVVLALGLSLLALAPAACTPATPDVDDPPAADDDTGPGDDDTGPGDDDTGPGDDDTGPGDDDTGPADDDSAAPCVEGGDADGDAYLPGVDCDDCDPEVHPGAEELCN